ncbi:hypothetical protein D3C71_1840610 [compost metagenome]
MNPRFVAADSHRRSSLIKTDGHAKLLLRQRGHEPGLAQASAKSCGRGFGEGRHAYDIRRIILPRPYEKRSISTL